MGVWAVVPVKELDRAKERLAPALPPERRRAPMLAMLEGVMTALGAATGLSGVAAAASLLAVEGCSGMLTLPGDIPLVTPAEIAQLLAAHRPAPAFTIAPSRDERGSNAIICSPPDAVPLRFGEDSFFPHLRAAEACGIRPTVLRLPGIALDVDTPEDLAALTLVPPATRAHALLDLQRAAAVIGEPWG